MDHSIYIGLVNNAALLLALCLFYDLLRFLPRHPGLKVLFMSGYTANVIAHHGVLDKEIHFLQKPFSKQELALNIREVLES